jgi:DNA polymerase I-like protein with 3'-5' exonuclease and polymerase domains
MYFTAFPAIKRWHKQIEQQLRRNNNVLVTALGRERKFFERWGDDLLRKATAFLPQSTIADLLDTIMLKWFNQHNDWTKVSSDGYIYTGDLLGSELLLQQHDAFYTQCPKDNIHPHIDTLKECFIYPITINRHTVNIPVGIKITECWGGKEISG